MVRLAHRLRSSDEGVNLASCEMICPYGHFDVDLLPNIECDEVRTSFRELASSWAQIRLWIAAQFRVLGKVASSIGSSCRPKDL